MNTSSNTPITDMVRPLVASLEAHEGTLTEREWKLCTTMLYGLAAAGRLSTPPERGADGTFPDFTFETATEGERWAYDQGYEVGVQAALDPATMGLEEVNAVLTVVHEALTGIIAEAEKAAER